MSEHAEPPTQPPKGQTQCWFPFCDRAPRVQVKKRLQSYPVKPATIWVCEYHARRVGRPR